MSQDLVFDRDGLIPAVVQDCLTGEVLMVAYANAEAYRLMKETGHTHFWSRSRQKMWKKGEESGHVQKIVSIQTDCDSDTLLIRVEQTGVACHTGAPSCFYKNLYGNPDATAGIIAEIMRVIKDRKENPSDESYTCKLFKDESKMCKKLVEEATEFILAIKDRDEEEASKELADLIYHTLVAVVAKDMDLTKTYAELAGRRQ